MSDALPLVTGLLPAWNAEEFIQPTLDALSAQTYQNYRVLASVDLCTDRTAEIIHAHAARDSRFHVIEQTKRLGWIGNVNALIDAAKGPYFHFAFHDDLILPHYVAACVDRLENEPAAVLAFTDMDTSYTDGRVDNHVYTLMEGVTSPEARAAKVISMKGAWWTPNRGVFRSSAARSVGGMKKHRAGEFIADWHWLLSLAFEGEFKHVPGVLVKKRFMENSLSQSWRWSFWKVFAAKEQAAKIIIASKLSILAKTRLLILLAFRFFKTTVGRAWRGFRSAK